MKSLQQIKLEAKSLHDSGDFTQACERFEQALEHNKNDIDALIGLGLSYVKLQDLKAAKSWLQAANEEAEKKAIQLPPQCYFCLANIHQQDNDYDKAIEFGQATISIRPNFPQAHLLLASLHMSKKELGDAEYHYNYAIKLQPDNADAYANLAQVYELANQIDNARSAVNKALELKDDHLGALLALAKIEKREKNNEDAERVFRKIITLTSNQTIQAMAYIDLAHVLDKQKKFDDAFDSSTQGQELWAQAIQPLPFDTDIYKQKIIKNISFFINHNTGRKIDHSDDNRSPIFFVGFPRSGTTLTEQILNQHPVIVTSDEEPFIDTVIETIPQLSQTSLPCPDCLSELSNDDLARIRRSYWDEVSTTKPDFDRDSILVDKLPLNIIQLGLINTLFPNAHILVAIRDPRDVCLSAFMQAFSPNPAMINFSSMQSTVNFYSQVMGLWLQYRETLTMNYHQYRYEDLVTDFDRTTREIFSFLELEYPDNASDFHISASNRTIRTPSYQDVATPVYQRSKARWRNYESKLKPYMSTLEPFIKEFGYEQFIAGS